MSKFGRIAKRLIGKKETKEQTPLRTAQVLDKYLGKHYKVWSLTQMTKTSMLLFGVLIVILSSWAQNYADILRDKHIAVIRITGEITNAEEGTGYNAAKAFQKAVKDTKAAAILLDVDSGGGSPTEAELLYSIIEDYVNGRAIIHDARPPTAKDGIARKPVYVSVKGMCASACYYAIAGADKIFAHRNSLLGSIGIRMDAYDVRELSDKLGVDKVTLSSGDNKTILDPFRGVSESDQALLESTIIKPLYRQFISDIEVARDGKLDSEAEHIYSGMVFPGERAIELGFADDIKTTLEVEQLMLSETEGTYIRVVNKPSFSFSRLLQSSISDALTGVLGGAVTTN